MQVHENEEGQAIILAKEAKSVLSLIHTRDTKNNENISNRHYHIQNINNTKNKKINITWDYRKFPGHPVAEEKF